MLTLAIAAFLSTPEQVEADFHNDADFQMFLAVAQKSSGDLPHKLDLAKARYRIVDARLGVLDDLSIDESVQVWGQPVAIRELLAASVTFERTRLVHSLWQLDTFDAVKSWLKAMRVLPRFAIDAEGTLRCHLLLAESIIPMVETVERKDYVLPNGDMASDAITRNYGVRAKVFALDRMRRSPRAGEASSMMDRLSRTLSKANR